MQRLFGVYAVHVQTGGGGAGGEIVLEAVGLGDVERAAGAAGRSRPPPVAEAGGSTPSAG